MASNNPKSAALVATAVAVIAVGVLAADDRKPAPAQKEALGAWGTAVDPDGDCQFAIQGEGLTVTAPGSDHVLGVERGKMNAPRVLRAADGDFIAQVRVSVDFPEGATAAVPNKPPVLVAGLVLFVDDGTYVRLERASVEARDERLNYVNWEVRKDREWTRHGSSQEAKVEPSEHLWLRLERRGERLLGYHSADAVQWQALPPIELKLPPAVKVGVTVGHNTTTPHSAAFAGYKLFGCVAATPMPKETSPAPAPPTPAPPPVR
jgi:regulation of enolase protein 1 (concanavalin A-like superfamily)